MPNPMYMDSQKELTWTLRGILVHWLIQVHAYLGLMPETLFLTVNVIDHVLSARVVSLAKLLLVGITSLFISSKVEEVMSPPIVRFLNCTATSYTRDGMLQAERYVLKTLKWNLSYANPIYFLQRVSRADDHNVKARTIAQYLIEISCLEWRLLSAPHSLLAAAAIWLACLILNNETWVHHSTSFIMCYYLLCIRQTPNLVYHSSYDESQLVPTANIMLNYVLKPTKHESFYQKYADKKYFKVCLLITSA